CLSGCHRVRPAFQQRITELPLTDQTISLWHRRSCFVSPDNPLLGRGVHLVPERQLAILPDNHQISHTICGAHTLCDRLQACGTGSVQAKYATCSRPSLRSARQIDCDIAWSLPPAE